MPFGKPKLPRGVKDVFKDRAGRIVVLTEDRWRHITKGHPAMEGLELAVKSAVETADVKRRGKVAGVERLFAQNLGPAKWLVVVIAYGSGNRGDILTAYPQTKDPGPEDESE